MALPVYSTGTVSVAALGTIVTGTGVSWNSVNVKEGDFISIAGLAEVLVLEVTDTTHLKIAPWQGGVLTNVAYQIFQNYVGRVVGVAAAEDVGVMLEKLHTDGLPFILDPTETVPDPSYGDDGQMAFKPTTGEWWLKTGGAWIAATGYGSDTSRVLKVGDTMTGDLTISKAANSKLILNQTASHTSNYSKIDFNIGGVLRWEISGAWGLESGGNTGSNFSIDRFSNAGAFLSSAISIERSSGNVNIASTTASGSIALGALVVAGGVGIGEALNVGGRVGAAGVFATVTKGNLLGNPGGTSAASSVSRTDANIFVYDNGGSNWAGIGADGAGNMWFRVGISGTPTPAFYLQASDNSTNFLSPSVNLSASSGTNLNFSVTGTRRAFINHNGSSFNWFSSNTGTTGLYVLPSASAWTSMSDARLPYKKTATLLTVLDKLDAVQLYEAQVEGRLDLFVKAQEFNLAFPHLVKVGSGPDDYIPESMAEPAAWGVSYDRAGVVALQGLKEAMQVIEQLQARITALEA